MEEVVPSGRESKSGAKKNGGQRKILGHKSVPSALKLCTMGINL